MNESIHEHPVLEARNERRRPKINNKKNEMLRWIVANACSATLTMECSTWRVLYKKQFQFVCSLRHWRCDFPIFPISLSLAFPPVGPSSIVLCSSSAQQYSLPRRWRCDTFILRPSKKIDLLFGHVHGKQNDKYAHTFLFCFVRDWLRLSAVSIFRSENISIHG